MELINLDNLSEVLNAYAVEVRNLYQDKLIKEGRVASGDLLNSVECRVESNGREYSVILNLADYWRYIETGTEPHWPPPSALLRWITIKPVLPRPGKGGKIPTPRQLAYLIGRKIAEEGTEGSYALTNSVAEINAKYREKFVAAFTTDMNGYVREIFK